MCTIISVINNKGGVGKTTSTGIISQLLSYLGKKVLVIDLDQQSNLSMMLNCYIDDPDDVINGMVLADVPNIAEVFRYRYRSKEDVEAVIQHTFIENLDIIPSSKRHKNTQLQINMNETANNNIILKKALATIKNEYDYILLDNAPANDILTVNSMFASDLVIIPVRVEGFSYKGLNETIETINYIVEEHELESIKLGAFITQAETNTNVFKALFANYSNELVDKFYQVPIRKDIKVSEIETNFCPILEYCPDTNAVFDYSRLILEMNILPPEDAQRLQAAIS